MIRACALSLALACAAHSGGAQMLTTSGTGAVLRALDKVSGQTMDVEITPGGGKSVFRLEVDLADCRYPADNPTGDAFAYLTIRDMADIVFEGWMIATSPALNALDHARYDIWVLRCISS